MRSREKNDCGVRALAFVFGIPYRTAHATLAKVGRKPRKGVSDTDMVAATALLGGRALVRRFPRGHRPMVKAVLGALDYNKYYYVATKSHVFGVVEALANEPESGRKKVHSITTVQL